MGAMMAATTPESKSWIPFMIQIWSKISFPYPWLFDGLSATEKSKAEKIFL